MQIQGNTFIVTGGGSGLGAGTATILAEAGANVVIADIRPASETAFAQNSKVKFVSCDVTDEASVQTLIATTVSTFGALHGAINCAGIGVAEKTIGREGAHSLSSFTRVVQVNLIGTFNVIRLAAAQMAGQAPFPNGERGVIINTASIAAYDGQLGQAAYAASKGGIVGMTLPIARDLCKFGIRVMTIAPGLFNTPLLAALPQQVKEVLGASVPFPSRLGDPREYAALAKHIIENEMLNGEVIRLDGALRMPPK